MGPYVPRDDHSRRTASLSEPDEGRLPAGPWALSDLVWSGRSCDRERQPTTIGGTGTATPSSAPPPAVPTATKGEVTAMTYEIECELLTEQPTAMVRGTIAVSDV